MSAAEHKAAALKAALQMLEDSFPGITATKYLSAAGLVILLYDHLLLLGDEKRVIWPAKLSWSKVLFLGSRYTVPVFMSLTAYQLSGISTRGLSTNFCRIWLSMVTFFCSLSLAIANVFVVHRVYALWGCRKRVLMFLAPIFIMVYIATFTLTSIAISRLLPHITYSPLLKTCVVDEKPPLFIAGYAVPLCFDFLLFILTFWNALARPRHMHTVLVSQLYFDGGVFFAVVLTLRVFTIVIVMFAPLAYVQLGVYFLWAMIMALIHRMLITLTDSLEDSLSAPPARDLESDSASAYTSDKHEEVSVGAIAKSRNTVVYSPPPRFAT